MTHSPAGEAAGVAPAAVDETSAATEAPPELLSLEDGQLRDDARLWQLCQDFAAVERFLDDPDFDAAAVVGELRAGMEKKVDAIVFMVEELQNYAARRAERAKKLRAQADSASWRAEQILDYVEQTMKAGNFEALPGAERKLYFHGCAPLVVTNREPTARDFLQLGTFVRRVPESYSWDKKMIGDALKLKGDDGAPIVSFDFAELKPHSSLRIGEQVPETIQRKPKKKKANA